MDRVFHDSDSTLQYRFSLQASRELKRPEVETTVKRTSGVDDSDSLVIPSAAGANATATEESAASSTRNHLPQNLLHNFRRHRRRRAGNIPHRIKLHHIRAYNFSLNRIEMRNRLPHRQPAWLTMGNSRRKRRIQRIHVEADIHRPRRLQLLIGRQRPHLHHFRSKSLRLLLLMPVEGANPYLHQSLRQPCFHDPRKGTSMREPAASELVIQIGVRIKMKHCQLRMKSRNRLHYGERDRMISPQRNGPLSLFH